MFLALVEIAQINSQTMLSQDSHDFTLEHTAIEDGANCDNDNKQWVKWNYDLIEDGSVN